MDKYVLELIIMISKRKDGNMKKFKPMKTSTRDVMLHYIDETNGKTNKQFEKQLKIIYALSELLQARASIENNGKEITNESTN